MYSEFVNLMIFCLSFLQITIFVKIFHMVCYCYCSTTEHMSALEGQSADFLSLLTLLSIRRLAEKNRRGPAKLVKNFNFFRFLSLMKIKVILDFLKTDVIESPLFVFSTKQRSRGSGNAAIHTRLCLTGQRACN